MPHDESHNMAQNFSQMSTEKIIIIVETVPFRVMMIGKYIKADIRKKIGDKINLVYVELSFLQNITHNSS